MSSNGKHWQVEEHSRVQGRCSIWLSCEQWSNQEHSWKMPGLTSRHNVMERWHGSKKTFRENHRWDLTSSGSHWTYGTTSNFKLTFVRCQHRYEELAAESKLRGSVCSTAGWRRLLGDISWATEFKEGSIFTSLSFFFFNLSPTQKQLWTKPGAWLALGIT